jgi:hypothetical protein
MIVIVVLISMGLLVYGIRQAVITSVPAERRMCSVCGTRKRTLVWMKSWEDWYCWPCKEKCIHAIVNLLIGGLP